MPESRDHDRIDGQANARLTTARDTRETVDLILSVRGRVVNLSGRQHQRWRIRTQGGHVLTFRPEFVLAITSAQRRPKKDAPPRLAVNDGVPAVAEADPA